MCIFQPSTLQPHPIDNPSKIASIALISLLLIYKAANHCRALHDLVLGCSTRTLENVTPQHFHTLGALQKWLREAILQRLNHELDLRPGVLPLIVSEACSSLQLECCNHIHFMYISRCSLGNTKGLYDTFQNAESLACVVQESSQ